MLILPSNTRFPQIVGRDSHTFYTCQASMCQFSTAHTVRSNLHIRVIEVQLEREGG